LGATTSRGLSGAPSRRPVRRALRSAHGVPGARSRGADGGGRADRSRRCRAATRGPARRARDPGSGPLRGCVGAGLVRRAASVAQAPARSPRAGPSGLEPIEARADRAARARFARALLYNNVGTVELARDQRGRALAYFERALVESRNVTGPGALELVFIRHNL